MYSWSGLPNEILGIIFRNLVHRITNKKISHLLDGLSVYHGKNTRSPGNNVKTLNFSALTDCRLVRLLGRAFPYLKYMYFDTDLVHTQSFIQEVHRCMEEGLFPYLKRVPGDRWDETRLNLALARKDKMRNIRLQDSEFDTKKDELLQKFSLFHRLEYLELNFSNSSSPLILEDLLRKTSPSLKSLNLYFPRPGSLIIGTSLAGIGNIRPALGLKDVKIDSHQVLSGEDKVLLYLKKKFSAVDTLRILNYSETTTDIRNNTLFTANCMASFLVFLNNRRRAHAAFTVNDHMIKDVVEKFFQDIFTRSSPTLKKAEVELDIVLDETRIENEAQEFQVYKPYIAVYNSSYGQQKQCKMQVVYTEANVYNVEYLGLCKRIKNVNLSSLVIENLKNHIPGYFLHTTLNLDTILDLFRKLKRLIIIGGIKFAFNESDWRRRSSKLESLELSPCRLTQEDFKALTRKFKTLKLLKFYCCLFETYRFGSTSLLNRIIMPYTRIECLTFVLKSPDNLAFKLTTRGDKSTYCGIIKNRFCEYFDAKSYKSCVKDAKCDLYYVNFKEVKKLTLQIIGAGYNSTKVFLEEDL